MRVKKFLAALAAFVFLLIFMAGNCFAGTHNEEYLAFLKDNCPDLYARELEGISSEPINPLKQSLLEDMKKNPQNYIESGSYWAFNNICVMTQYYIFQPSLEVKQYAPPKYIISIKRVSCLPGNEEAKNFVSWHYTYKFLYDYDEQKIYMRNIDSNNQPYWEYLDPIFANVRNEQHAYDLEAAELAFYFAYNQSFFKKPLSKNFKKHIKKGNFKTFADYKDLKIFRP